MKLSEFRDSMDSVMDKFYETEADLLGYRTGDTSTMVNERTISSHIARIIDNKLGTQDYKVDTEYNRHGDDIKKLNGRKVYPDILIHKRRTDNNNFAWIEVKKANANAEIKDIEKDRERLVDVTRQNGEYRYKYGALIIIGKDESEYNIEYYQNGKNIASQQPSKICISWENEL